MAKLGVAVAVASSPVLFENCASGLPAFRGQVENGVIRVPKTENPHLLEKGGLLAVRARGLPIQIVLRNLGGGELAAFSTVCTHKGCEVRVMPDGFECPCHGSAFELDGVVAEGPASEPLQRFEVIDDENEYLIKVK